jgi:hypothetical protein
MGPPNHKFNELLYSTTSWTSHASTLLSTVLHHGNRLHIFALHDQKEPLHRNNTKIMILNVESSNLIRDMNEQSTFALEDEQPLVDAHDPSAYDRKNHFSFLNKT